MSTPTNTAAYLDAAGASLSVRSAPFPVPGPGQLVVQTKAVTVNPVDTYMQMLGAQLFPWLAFPTVLGCDVAGVVHSVGEGVTHFKPGDRVIAMSNGIKGGAPEGAWQHFMLARESVCGKIGSGDDAPGFEQASVVPIAMSTAAIGLYRKDCLALRAPSAATLKSAREGNMKGEKDKEYLLLWGGATTIGCNAIQLALASGYGVVTTASAKNHPAMRELGADAVFDYSDAACVSQIVDFLRGKKVAGAMVMAQGGLAQCSEVLISLHDGSEASEGMVRKFIAHPVMETESDKVLPGVDSKLFYVADIVDSEVGKMVWRDFLEEAIGNGSFLCEPEVIPAGKGLEALEGAMKRWKEGVSLGKVVVSLGD